MVQANPAFGQLLFGTPLMYVIMFAPLAMVMWISFKINSMSLASSDAIHIYATVMGLSLSTILFAFTGASVARAFFITAGAFGALSMLDILPNET